MLSKYLIRQKFDVNLNVRVLDTAENCVTFLFIKQKETTLGNGEFSDLQLDAIASMQSLEELTLIRV